MSPGGETDIDRTVVLSEAAYRLLCGRVHPSWVIDSDQVVASDEAWGEVRTKFPVSDYRADDDEETSCAFEDLEDPPRWWVDERPGDAVDALRARARWSD